MSEFEGNFPLPCAAGGQIKTTEAVLAGISAKHMVGVACYQQVHVHALVGVGEELQPELEVVAFAVAKVSPF